VLADEAYIRESIVQPGAKVVAGFQPVMPPFQGMVTEEQLLQLIAYVKSLYGPPAPAQPPASRRRSRSNGLINGSTLTELLEQRPRRGVVAVDEGSQAHRAALPVSITAFFVIGGLFAMMVRLELLTPEGDLLASETYNKMFTMHGVVMVFFFLIPSIPAVLGNFLLPIMVGAKDLAFPRINLLSWYIYVLGGLFTPVRGAQRRRGHGWTFYTPYSTAAANST
jgi:hypothetical protein